MFNLLSFVGLDCIAVVQVITSLLLVITLSILFIYDSQHVFHAVEMTALEVS
jgi:hypothetical protein